MGSITAIPFIGWVVGPIIAFFSAIPFYVIWHWMNIKKFFYFLPDIYLNIGFWDLAFLFIIVSFLKSLILPSFSCTCKVEK